MHPPSRAEMITAELRDEILRAQYREGERLPSERDLAERFGVHRGAVREALKKLEQLGLVDIRRGGARVLPIDQASLDVVDHLLELEDPPDLQMVDQVLEVLSGMFSLAARLAAERASDEQLLEVEAILVKLAEQGDLPSRVGHDLLLQLGELFVDASHNLVLGLARRGIKSRFVEHLGVRGIEATVPPSVRIPLVRSLSKAMKARDGAGASEAMFRLALEVRRNTIEELESGREEAVRNVAAGRGDGRVRA
jgi:GntR family transcriptional repressor for pyruvate dehydrogenase complex